MGPDDLAKVNVYLVDMGEFAAMNAVYATMFTAPGGRRGDRSALDSPNTGRRKMPSLHLFDPEAKGGRTILTDRVCIHPGFMRLALSVSPI